VPGKRNISSPNKSLALNYTRVLGPTLVNELLVTGSRQEFWQGTGDPGVRYADALGLPNPFAAAGWPRINETGLTDYDFINVNTLGTPFLNLGVDNNVSKVLGRHQLKFGFHIIVPMTRST
jgi:hypothetical protein